MPALFPVLLAAAFLFVVIDGRRLPRGAGNFPFVFGVFGLALLVLYLVREAYFFRRARRSGVSRQRQQILDLDSDYSAVSATEVRDRTVRVFGSLAAITMGVWLVNFHIAIPLFLVSYLRAFSATSWRSTITLAIVFEAIIVVFYGLIVHVPWGESVIEDLGGFSLQQLLGGPIQALLPF